jgi:hypothetical protein
VRTAACCNHGSFAGWTAALTFRGVIAAALLLAVGSAIYTARHFAIDTDINDLVSTKLSHGGSRRSGRRAAAFALLSIAILLWIVLPWLI